MRDNVSLYNLYYIAYELKKSYNEVSDLSEAEIRGWLAFFEVKNERELSAMRKHQRR